MLFVSAIYYEHLKKLIGCFLFRIEKRKIISIMTNNKISSNLNVYIIYSVLQVHRALKHAVNAGLLRHRSGRYKTLVTLNSNSVFNSPNKESVINNQKSEEIKSKSDVQTPISDIESPRQTQERKYAVICNMYFY